MDFSPGSLRKIGTIAFVSIVLVGSFLQFVPYLALASASTNGNVLKFSSTGSYYQSDLNVAANVSEIVPVNSTIISYNNPALDFTYPRVLDLSKAGPYVLAPIQGMDDANISKFLIENGFDYLLLPSPTGYEFASFQAHLARTPLLQRILADRWVVAVDTNSTALIGRGMVGYWPFDEDAGTVAIDLSGNGHTLTAHTTGTGTAGWATGKFGYAASVSGDTGTAATNQGYYSGTTNITTPSALSACIWFYPTSAASYGTTIELAEDNTYVGRILYNQWGQVRLQLGAGGNVATVDITSNTTAPLNKWSQTCFTYDGVTTALYLNGASVGSSTALSGSLDTVTEVLVGNSQTWTHGFQYNFNGRLDTAEIWTQALTASQVQEDYSSYAWTLYRVEVPS